ncbi:hypothetical protein UlMin_012903 [Ulmus minor]
MDPVDVDVDVDVDVGDADFQSDAGSDYRDYDDDSSDPEIDQYYVHCITCKNRLFGRQRPLHLVLGGGLSADIILWRNKEISACFIAGETVIWLLFEWIGYHFISLLCHALLLSLALLFFWSNLASFINTSPPELPSIKLNEDSFVKTALMLRCEYHRALRNLGEAIFGTDLKTFLMAVVALWILSEVGSWFNFFTLFYLGTLILMTVPVLYENYEDIVDTFAEKALIEMKSQYKLFDEKVLKRLKDLVFHKNNKH